MLIKYRGGHTEEQVAIASVYIPPEVIIPGEWGRPQMTKSFSIVNKVPQPFSLRTTSQHAPRFGQASNRPLCFDISDEDNRIENIKVNKMLAESLSWEYPFVINEFYSRKPI